MSTASITSAIDAPLVFCAPSVPINVNNLFKVPAPPARRLAPLCATGSLQERLADLLWCGTQVILIRLFALKHAVPQIVGTGEPLVLYEPVDISVEVSHPSPEASKPSGESDADAMRVPSAPDEMSTTVRRSSALV